MLEFEQLSDSEKKGVANLMKVMGYSQEQAVEFVIKGRDVVEVMKKRFDESKDEYIPQTLLDRWDNDPVTFRILTLN